MREHGHQQSSSANDIQSYYICQRRVSLSEAFALAAVKTVPDLRC